MGPNNATRKCKVCGAEYPYCKTWGDPLIFRWQDVACCQEHASVYLERMKEKIEPVETVDEKDVLGKANAGNNGNESVERKPAAPKKSTRKPKKKIEGEAD